MRRIFAQGFTAAERLTREQRRVGEIEGFAALNPYEVEPRSAPAGPKAFDRARSMATARRRQEGAAVRAQGRGVARGRYKPARRAL